MPSSNDIQQETNRLEEYENHLLDYEIEDYKRWLYEIGSYLIETEPNEIDDNYISKMSSLLHKLKVRSIRSGWNSREQLIIASSIAAGLMEIILHVAGGPRPSKFFEDVTRLGLLLELVHEFEW